jgi:hypothetical protein
MEEEGERDTSAREGRRVADCMGGRLLLDRAATFITSAVRSMQQR